VSEDYLWDPSAPVDPEVQRLEHVLGRLRSVPPAPLLPKRSRWSSRLGYPALVLAAAAAVLLIIAVGWRGARAPEQESPWRVTSLEGRPLVGRAAVAPETRLAVGQTLVTDSVSRAQISAETVGQIVVGPDSRVRLVVTRDRHHRLALDRGTLHAFIVAPPGQFLVDTRSATAVDLGCAYSLHVAANGEGFLSVEAGWVGFEWRGRESFVPAGASCRTSPDLGPGSPRYDDADTDFKEALDEVDAPGASPGRERALRVVLDRARRRDALTLWHLLPRVQPSERDEVFAALAARVPPPAGVTRDLVARLDRTALERWWDTLGLGEVSFWRMWERPLPSGAAPR